jgi:hypothetical protein
MNPSMSALVTILVVGLTTSGCGSDSGAGSADSSNNCIITFSGNKLCGNDGKAWCERFAGRLNADAGTRAACTSVGAELSGAEISDTDPIAIASEINSELGTKYSDYDISVSSDGQDYTVAVEDYLQEAVPQKVKRRICKSARAIDGVGNAPVTVLDLYGSDYTCPSRAVLGVE